MPNITKNDAKTRAENLVEIFLALCDEEAAAMPSRLHLHFWECLVHHFLRESTPDETDQRKALIAALEKPKKSGAK